MNFGKGMATKQRVEIVMAKLQEKAQAQVKQMVGQMIGDDQLMEEGREQQQKADQNEKQQSKAKEGAQTIKRNLPKSRCRRNGAATRQDGEGSNAEITLVLLLKRNRQLRKREFSREIEINQGRCRPSLRFDP